MRIGIICSTSAYGKIPEVAQALEKLGHVPVMPNCYDEPVYNEDTDRMSEEMYLAFFKSMYMQSRERTASLDAVLVLNEPKTKNGTVFPNYIGAATFLEMYEAFMQGKKIFIYYDLPDSMLLDEIKGFAPILLNGDLTAI